MENQSPAQQPQLIELGNRIRFNQGEEIYRADFLVGDPPVFWIMEGKVEVIKKYTPLQTESFHYEKGDLFGMLEVYTGTQRLTSAHARTDVEVIGYTRDNFEKAMSSNLNFALLAIRLLSKMLREINVRIKNLS